MTMTRALPKELIEAVQRRCDSRYDELPEAEKCNYPVCDGNCALDNWPRQYSQGWVQGWNAALRAMATWAESQGQGPFGYQRTTAHANSLIIGEGK